MNIADMARLHDATLRAFNVRNYLRRKEMGLETDLDAVRAELAQAETVYGQLQARCKEAEAPKLPGDTFSPFAVLTIPKE